MCRYSCREAPAGADTSARYPSALGGAAYLFSDQERAALAWTEEVTRVSETHASDDAYAAALSVFGEKDLVELTLVIAAMNAINRMGISFRMKPLAKA